MSSKAARYPVTGTTPTLRGISLTPRAIRIFGKFICRDTSAYMVGALIRSGAYFKSGGFHDAGVRYAGDACMGLGLIRWWSGLRKQGACQLHGLDSQTGKVRCAVVGHGLPGHRQGDQLGRK